MIVERLRLDGRAVLISGAGGGGIGTATSVAVAEAGATVIGTDIDAASLDITREAVAGAGGKFVGVVADSTVAVDVERAVATAVAETGPIHGAVSIVGGAMVRHWLPVLDYPVDLYDEQIRLNLMSAFLVSQAAARSMVDHGVAGSIVCLASISGDRASPFHVAYGAAKAAVRHMVGTMALELGDHGIRVNAVSPGTIRSPRAQAPADPERDRAVPLRRRGEVEEIAGPVLFLLSDLSSYVSGHTLVVDGGASDRLSFVDVDNMPIFVGNPEIRARLAT